jgi:hypothetical protein
VVTVAELDVFARAIRAAESGSPEGNYEAVRGRIRNGARLIGAYGVASDEWDRLAEEAGYRGAKWRSQAAQDAVVKKTFEYLYDKYQDWRLVAVAWKAGEEVADAIAADPDLLRRKELAPVKNYASQVMGAAATSLIDNEDTYEDGTLIQPGRFQATLRGLRQVDSMQEGQEGGASSSPPPPPGSARQTLTGMLRAMRDRQRAAAEASQTAENGPDGPEPSSGATDTGEVANG